MGFNDFMSKIRQWDILTAKWINRHFYLLFFEIILVIIFIVFFVNSLKVIDLNIVASTQEGKLTEQILISQSLNLSIIVMLLLLNSFWMLFMFNSILRISSTLRELNYLLNRRKHTES